MRHSMKLIFRNCSHHLESVTDKYDCPASSLKLLGKPLIVRNVSIASNIHLIGTVMIPKEFPSALALVQDNFPSMNVEEYHDNSEISSIAIDNTINPSGKLTIRGNGESLELPLNSVLHYSRTGNLLIDSIVYPWDFLDMIQKTLQEEITHTVISPSASIAKSSIIDGPCIIEDDVTIDDFCKIKGPTYISKGSFIGMSSLIRNCMMGNETRIGFNCEIAKSYFAGNTKIAHQNVILDSIIGKNVWFGGYSGTANVLLNRRNIRYDIGGNGKLVDTGTDHFGAVVGNNCAIGASVIILPGRQVPHNTVIQAGTIVGKNNNVLAEK
jgi:carbonic anhydrase/acetyltransferase-like protein (isoleucine patch superfamily)